MEVSDHQHYPVDPDLPLDRISETALGHGPRRSDRSLCDHAYDLLSLGTEAFGGPKEEKCLTETVSHGNIRLIGFIADWQQCCLIDEA